jgi:hypothetical protein
MQEPIQKTTKTKRNRGAAQVVELLPRKGKALSLNPSTTKERKRGQPSPCWWSILGSHLICLRTVLHSLRHHILSSQRPHFPSPFPLSPLTSRIHQGSVCVHLSTHVLSGVCCFEGHLYVNNPKMYLSCQDLF